MTFKIISMLDVYIHKYEHPNHPNKSFHILCKLMRAFHGNVEISNKYPSLCISQICHPL